MFGLLSENNHFCLRMIKLVFYGFLLTFALADEVADKFEENEVNPDVVASGPSALLKVI